ncbi:hypothetical protein [Streptomyces sp. NRRL B-1347]|uniref:MmyB family transcriptional regulator n=1 Tax=Streptomyces sp. NRRL B-1347 TaxID=1476877 RepID=UPI00131D5CB0|nr:hypothetical protein [Streptomyces sp. NRRL B-1347]
MLAAALDGCRGGQLAAVVGDSGEPGVVALARVGNGQRLMSYLTDHSWNLLLHNQAFCEVFENNKPPRNPMEWMCLSPWARTVILLDWHRIWAPAGLNQVKNAVKAYPRNPVLLDMARRINQDPEARPIWKGINEPYTHPDGDSRPFFHPKYGAGWIDITASTPLGMHNGRLVTLDFRRK